VRLKGLAAWAPGEEGASGMAIMASIKEADSLVKEREAGEEGEEEARGQWRVFSSIASDQ